MVGRIEQRPVDQLLPYANNARMHSEAQIEQIAASIQEFGFVNPILIGADGGIIAGHGRLLAARELAYPEVPVIVLDHLTEVQKRAFALADNKLALNATWDLQLLQLELESLAKDGFPVELTGFDEKELHELLAQEARKTCGDPDEFPELSRDAVSCRGDLWVLGPHRVLCGDGTSREDIASVLQGEPCDLVFTDLPYDAQDCGETANKVLPAEVNGQPALGSFLELACSAMLTAVNGPVYICTTPRQIHDLYSAFSRSGGQWSAYIVCEKSTVKSGSSEYQQQYDTILYGWRKEAIHCWYGDRRQSDMWHFVEPIQSGSHATTKPVALIERVLRNSSRSGDVVLDTFAGPGATLIACHNLKRQARLIEIDPQWVDVIVRRWQAYTGLSASSDANGKSFNDVAAERRSLKIEPSVDHE